MSFVRIITFTIEVKLQIVLIKVKIMNSYGVNEAIWSAMYA